MPPTIKMRQGTARQALAWASFFAFAPFAGLNFAIGYHSMLTSRSDESPFGSSDRSDFCLLFS